ncbi:MAG TPA: type II toxin-antitoxin system HicB family antitoxin [Candidatus Thermoplasmatota archaeon]|nr:type II toxin-antitoxin system HicB family antitoxin [Candidatus Thermoplasmatota archaeon]
MKHTLTVVLERDVGGGFIASVPALPGCFSQGETLDEVRASIREAIALYLEGEPARDLPEFIGIERVEVDA